MELKFGNIKLIESRDGYIEIIAQENLVRAPGNKNASSCNRLDYYKNLMGNKELIKDQAEILGIDYKEHLKSIYDNFLRIKENREVEVYKKRNQRSNKYRRLIITNFQDKSHFVTLTFAKHIEDLTEAHNLVKNALKRLRYLYKKNNVSEPLKYVFIPERHQNGSIHYHGVINSGNLYDYNYINNIKARKYKKSESRKKVNDEMLKDWWGHGWIDAQSIQSNVKLASYTTKYIIKAYGEDDFEKGSRRVLKSSNLKAPREEKMNTTDILEVIKDLEKSGYKLNYNKNFESDICGNGMYLEFIK